MSLLSLQSSSSKVFVTLFSRIITALVGIIFVPIYVRIIGIESYGLVAFYGTLAGSLNILDFGLSTAISRQVAILRAQQGKEKEMKDLVFSVEIIYWVIALSIGLLIIALAGLISEYWVNAKDLPLLTIKKAVMLMGVVFTFQFPVSIYNGVMIGLEKQVANGILTIIFTILKAVGVIFLLKMVSPTIECYFSWQAFVTLLSIITLRIFVWKKIRIKKMPAVFSTTQLKTIWRFAAGMTGISLITFFLTQIDKIVVSKMVLLEFVGYYNLAFLTSGMITQLISPLQPVIFPRFSALASQRDNTALMRLYHKSCRWVSIIVFPIGLGMIFFAKDILLVWTNNPVLAEHTAPVMQVCAAGTICNCMLLIPYFYMLANGITRFTIYQNIFAAIILVPLLFWWTREYGILGASFVWLAVNAGYVLISIPLIHSLYIKGELRKWYLDDFIIVLLLAFAVVSGIKISSLYFFDANLTLTDLFLLAGFGAIIYGFIIRDVRYPVFQYLRKKKLFYT